MGADMTDTLKDQVAAAFREGRPLRIRAGDTRAWYGNRVEGEEIDVSGHSGIIDYQPSELVVRVRAGTRLAELEDALRASRQMLAFEPPRHGEASTIGGAIACGLSGPRRAACGSARDFMLGATVINGRGERLRFGGQVMKNVAGYDAARLMVGAQGTLGLLLDVSLKVLPLPEAELTLKLDMGAGEMPAAVLRWVRQGLPLSATCHWRGALHLRLSSTPSAVRHARSVIAAEHACEEADPGFWAGVRDQTHPFFAEAGDLWRCSHLPTTPLYGDPEGCLLEWNGALRWVRSGEPLHEVAASHHGHAQRHPLRQEARPDADIFQPLAPDMAALQRRLRQGFDPAGILNPGRLYAAEARP